MARNWTRREFLRTGLAVTGAALLVGCQPTTGGTPGAAGAPSGSEAATGPTAAPAEVSGPREGGTLRVAFGSQRDDLFPYHPHGRVNVDVNRRIYSSLVSLDPDLNMMGDLAESWEVSEDGVTWTFHLRDGIKWHDGEPFTANDVVFTFTRIADPAVAAWQSPHMAPIKGVAEFAGGTAPAVEGLTAPDDGTVQITLNQPFSGFGESIVLDFVIPEHILGDVAPGDLRTHSIWSTKPIGTGSYKVSNYVPKQTIEYERHVDYHLGKPYIEKMVWSTIPETETQLLAIQRGDIDYVYSVPANADTLESLRNNPDLYVMENDSPRVQQLGINWERFPDIRVRQAICHAIDRNALWIASGGEGVSIQTDHYFQNPWAAEGALKWGDVYSYDPDKARELLEAADWDMDRTLNFTGTGTEPSTQMVIIQEQLQAIGLKVEILLLETNTIVQREGDYDLLISGYAPLVPYDVAIRFNCASIESGSPLTHYCNPEFDATLAEEAFAKTVEERREYYLKLQEMLVNDAVSVLLPRSPNRAVFRKNVHAEQWSWYAMDMSWKWWMDT